MDLKLHLIIIILLSSAILSYADKDRNNTLEYFKTVGIEIAKLMCNNLDMLIETFGEDENRN